VETVTVAPLRTAAPKVKVEVVTPEAVAFTTLLGAVALIVVFTVERVPV
jgi:hypothetical protein